MEKSLWDLMGLIHAWEMVVLFPHVNRLPVSSPKLSVDPHLFGGVPDELLRGAEPQVEAGLLLPVVGLLFETAAGSDGGG